MTALQGLIKSLPFSVKSTSAEKEFFVEGWASKPVVDRVDDVVLPEAFKESIERFKSDKKLLPPLRLNHEVPVGSVVDMDIKDDGLYVKASIASGYEEADKARAMVEQNVMRFFSIGFIPKTTEWKEVDNKTVRVIKELDLLEISLVDVPACQDAVFEYSEKGICVKILDPKLDDKKKASGKTTWPLADRERAWDKRKALSAIRKWASSDGSGDLDKVDWKKMQQVHFWFDEDKPDQMTSYKLLFCDVIDGHVYAIPRAIFACAVVIQGGRSGLDIPEEDLPKVKQKVASYYHKMDEQAPWEREKSYLISDEVDTLVDLKVKHLQEEIENHVIEVIEKRKEEQDFEVLFDTVSDLYQKITSKKEE